MGSQTVSAVPAATERYLQGVDEGLAGRLVIGSQLDQGAHDVGLGQCASAGFASQPVEKFVPLGDLVSDKPDGPVHAIDVVIPCGHEPDFKPNRLCAQTRLRA